MLPSLITIWIFMAVARVYEDYRKEAERLRIELFPVVRGTITEHDKEIVITKGKNKQEVKKFVLSCTYRYHWQGTEHRAGAIRPRFKPLHNEVEADDLYVQLTPGREVKVYVNPAAPSEAYLFPGTELFTWTYTVGVLVFGFLLPLILAYCLYRFNQYADLADHLQFITS